MNSKKPFYADGLSFSCVSCSLCCRRDSGYVFLTENDLRLLLNELAMPYEEFVPVYCRWVKLGTSGFEFLSLKETSNYDCIFWKKTCSVYKARPLQCRNYPFWKDLLISKKIWKEALAECPGVGHGELHSKEFIESCIKEEKKHSIISRESRN
ncbi:MAG: YkgJ family cysteine cluster protein [Spirochaetaceae bacterium]|jgi:Fe-S-cluster containining protein|nr:YkgJ family cysteine cluster protein [Spirochaetaceae bacterium]